MKDEHIMTTAVAMPSKEQPGLEEPIVVSAEETPIAIRIRDALLAEPRLGGADLQVRVHDDHITISGTIRTEEQRLIVLDVARQYSGREGPVDEIQTGEQVSYDVCEA